MEHSLAGNITASIPTNSSLRVLPKTASGLILGLFVLWALPPAFIVAYIGLAIYALRGPKETLQSFCLMAILLLINPGLFAPPSLAKLLRWVVLFAGFGRVLFDSAPKPNQITYPILIFSSSIILLSVLASQNMAISILKVIAFGVGTYTIMTCYYRTAHLKHYWSSWFLTIGLTIFVCSLPLYATHWGYFRNGTGFQGILNHPQVYGPLAAPLTAWTTCLVLFSKEKNPAVVICMILGWAAIYTSQARTSLAMALGGIALAILVGFAFKQTWRSEMGKSFSVLYMIGMLVITSFISLLFGPQIMATVQSFILKGEESVSYEESFQGSRGFLIEQQMNNFRASPIAGIGFGVASNSEALHARTASSSGLPFSASVEKGFMPSAVLEEIGLTGAVLVLFLLYSLARPVFQGRHLYAAVILLTCLLVNVGEMVFFSLGGIGLFFWVMIGFAFNLSLPDNQQNAV